MDELRKLLKNQSSSAVEQFLTKVSTSKTQCTSFVAQASTAKVYKICKHEEECTKECLAVKVNLPNQPFDEKEVLVHEKITFLVKGTPAEAHFNKLIGILKGSKNEAIILQFEQPRAQPFQTLSQLLQKADISEELWRSINFQLIKTIYAAQQVIPGFSHNDTHTDNILVVPNETSHVCKIRSPKGRQLLHFGNVLIRIIDFGQVLATADDLQTRDGTTFYKHTVWKNKMIDFVRFAVWAIVDLSFYEEQQVEYPAWYQKWLEFVLRWIDPKFFVLGKKAEYVDPSLGMAPNDEGGKWLQEWYGPESKNGIGNMLDDPYFDAYEIKDPAFSAQIKPRQFKMITKSKK